MARFPVSGWETSAPYARQNPKVVAAFQRAIRQASAAAADRAAVEQVAPSYIKGMTPQLASSVHIMAFPTRLSRSRLQRVADEMLSVGLLTEPFDAGRLMPS